MSQKYYILADNQAITRAGLNFIIRELHLSERIIHIYSKQELPDLLKKNSQAIIILDYTLFDFSRIEELINLHERFPSVRWILFSEELTTEFIRNIYSDKAFSVLFKNSSFQEISDALKYTISAKQYLCAQSKNQLQNNTEQGIIGQSLLTTTEIEILKLVAQGKSVKEIAAIRISSVHTIITHKKNIFRKLNVNNIHEATRYAFRAGIIDMAEYCI